MFAEERKEQIVSYVRANQRADIHELAERFQVSGATIRADLRDLETQGFLKRTHGGAIYREDMLSDKDGIASRDVFEQEKEEIARKAATLIRDGEAVILDAGSTSVHLARQLKDRKDLTVVVNDIAVAGELYQCQNIKILFCGGEMRPMYGCTDGAGTLAFIQKLSVDKAFISPNAVSVVRGAFTTGLGLAETKQAFMRAAEKKYLLCTSNKIGKKALCQIAAIGEFDAVFTDRGIRIQDKEAIEETGLPVYICEGE